MGYTTEFSGQFDLDRPLSSEHKAYLTAFNRTRRMKRDAVLTASLPDPKREAVSLPVGDDGAYFVGSQSEFGQDRSPDVVDYNTPPVGQPGLWCQWTPNDDGTAIEWDGGEKFYHYTEWIRYIIENFIAPWGYAVNGEVEWAGEDRADIGKIVVINNEVEALTGFITYA